MNCFTKPPTDATVNNLKVCNQVTTDRLVTNRLSALDITAGSKIIAAEPLVITTVGVPATVTSTTADGQGSGPGFATVDHAHALDDTGVVLGVYENTIATVDVKGRLTQAEENSGFDSNKNNGGGFLAQSPGETTLLTATINNSKCSSSRVTIQFCFQLYENATPTISVNVKVNGVLLSPDQSMTIDLTPVNYVHVAGLTFFDTTTAPSVANVYTVNLSSSSAFTEILSGNLTVLQQ